jgi:hypothetical protein
MTKPIPDKAEVALEYPDKLYIGTFERSSRFDAHLDATGISLMLERVGDVDTRKSIHMHINYELFAEILRDLAATVAAMPAQDVAHRETLADAARLFIAPSPRRLRIQSYYWSKSLVGKANVCRRDNEMGSRSYACRNNCQPTRPISYLLRRRVTCHLQRRVTCRPPPQRATPASMVKALPARTHFISDVSGEIGYLLH